MSAILSADDLNDFISPGVACIKPVETLPKQENSNPYEVTTEDKVQAENPAPASISLTDCLACSGCVTSAEAVLVSLQSHTEVLHTLDAYPSINVGQILGQQNGLTNGHDAPSKDGKIFVASVSPQVRASIAATFGIPERKAGYLIEQFLSGSQGLRMGGQHHNGFDYVVDTNRMREACLVLGADEVLASMAGTSKQRPILTSACPGWICYAEKTHPHVLPHLSTLKSPQALTGTLFKSVLSKALNIHPSQIWHLAIMPCFDKKLEASREELTDKAWSSNTESATAVRDVDCVITSRELLTLATARNIQLSTIPQRPLSKAESTPFPDNALAKYLFPRQTLLSKVSPQSSEAGTSGGYLYHILQTAQSQNPGSQIKTQKGRNADVIEYTLQSSTSTPIMKCARYYGFRNIQNLVRKLNPARQSRLPGAARRNANANGISAEYAYVEVMACPGGCTNGGGQIKIEDVASILPQTRNEQLSPEDIGKPQSQKEWLSRVDEAYFSASESSDTDHDLDTDTDIDVKMDIDIDVPDLSQANTKIEPSAVNGPPSTDSSRSPTINSSSSNEASTPTSTSISTTISIQTRAEAIHSVLAHWSDLVDVPLQKLAYTTFRKVESDVGKKSTAKKMGDSERIAAIAGLQGGGW